MAHGAELERPAAFKAYVSGSVCGTTVKYACGREVSLVFLCRTNALFLLMHKDTYNLTPFFLRAKTLSVVNNLVTRDYLSFPEEQIHVRLKGGDRPATPFFPLKTSVSLTTY